MRRAERTGRGIALEDLKGMRGRIRATRSQRDALHNWALAQLKQLIVHKAQRAGVPVEPDVDALETAGTRSAGRGTRLSRAPAAGVDVGAGTHERV